MKKTILSLAMLAAGFTMSAQESELQTFVLEDFESGVVTFTETVNINPPTEMEATVVENPSKTGENQSDKVWKWERKEATQNWAGFYATLKNEVPNGYHRIEVKYYRTDANSQLKIRCEGANGGVEFLPVTAPTKVNEWETLVFDLRANNVANVIIFGMQPDFRDAVEDLVAGTVTYIDDITFVYDETVAPITSEVLFHDSGDSRFYDQGIKLTLTAPSTLALEHWQNPEATDGDKFPVVTSPVKDGENALKLQWKSCEGGDWSMLIAAIGWRNFDLSELNYIKFYVNSPEELAGSALPKIGLRMVKDGEFTSVPVNMSDYITNLQANTWTEVIIPLADIWEVNTEYSALDPSKGLVFMQNAADNVEHTLYIDEVTFEKNSDTAIEEVLVNAKKVNYFNGLLSVSDYEGMVEVYDIAGQKVFASEMTNGSVACQLQQGVYIVRYAQGANKLIVR